MIPCRLSYFSTMVCGCVALFWGGAGFDGANAGAVKDDGIVDVSFSSMWPLMAGNRYDEPTGKMGLVLALSLALPEAWFAEGGDEYFLRLPARYNVGDTEVVLSDYRKIGAWNRFSVQSTSAFDKNLRRGEWVSPVREWVHRQSRHQDVSDPADRKL